MNVFINYLFFRTIKYEFKLFVKFRGIESKIPFSVELVLIVYVFLKTVELLLSNELLLSTIPLEYFHFLRFH